MQLSRIGPFALEEPLDGSAESNVLRGLHVERKLTMAVKLLPRSVAHSAMGRSSFVDDVKRFQKLVHPGIARIFGGAVEQGQPYLVLEMVAGESLREQLDRRGKLPWEVAVDIADGICVALDHAHQAGFVHQRLTPTRVLLPQSGGVKLVGFDGVWADRDEVLGLRAPMEVAHYLAPEEFRGKQSASLPQCDLFSLGVLLFECLSGESPWQADTPSELVKARRESEAPRVSTKVLDCPVWLDALVSRLLAVKRSDRLASADEAHRAIVTAKSKADTGVGAAQHAWSGKKGVLDVGQDSGELRRLRRQRTAQKARDPFYEQAWFLASCLAAVLGLGAWSMWPLSEEALFTKAKPLMDSESTADWKRAREQYLGPLLQRFPDSQYAEEIQAFEDRYAMHRAEERIKNLDRFGRKPKTEAERCFAEAWEYEQFGDRYTAWQKYEALINLFGEKENPDDRAFVNLAHRHIQQIKSSSNAQDDIASFLQNQIEQAQSLAATGKRFKARSVLDSLITLYAGNQEVRSLVEEARELIRQLDRGGDIDPQ
ncbi:MAG: serine/threonine protein kinase [Pirellulales bacterium]|nr:serine/threonine protein kinase [Pirellulales bacterium]